MLVVFPFYINLFSIGIKGGIVRISFRRADEKQAVVKCGPDLDDRGICKVDICDDTKCYPEPRVIIIGAGMAGLSAAARLSERGINNYVILEACERPGGRIHSCWLGDIVAELGACFRPEYKYNHPIYAMSLKETPPEIPGSVHARGLFNAVVTGKMDYPSMITAYYKFKQIEKETAEIYCLGGSKQHGSLINFMGLRIQQELHEYPEEQQHDAARILFGLTHMLSARSEGDTALLGTTKEGYFMNMPSGDVRVPLGLVGALAPILCQIREGAIRYCKAVNCIYWGACPTSGCRATVWTTDGDKFPADYVIITASVGVLSSQNLFCPELPASKVDSLRCLGMGYSNKIYLEYCRPFWSWHKGDICFKFHCNELYNRRDWTRGIQSIQLETNSKHVMSSVVAGEEARMLETLCDKDIAEGITDVLRCTTGNKSIPYPTRILRSCWSLDPYFLGAYSFEYQCSGGQTQMALACPLPGPSESIPPILLFAGEATASGHHGTVSGARISGIREAERIVNLTDKYKGPPLPQPKKEIEKKKKKIEEKE